MIKGEKCIPYFFLAPAVGILLIVVIFPLIYSLRLSFTNFTFGMPESEIAFIGLSNFIKLFQDSYFLNGLKLTVIFMLGTTFIAFLLGFGIALLLQRSFFGKRVVRTLVVVPMTITPVAVGIIWLLLFMPDYSFINYLLSLVKVTGPRWLLTPRWALISVMITYIWEWTPFFTLMLSAGLAGLPREPYEAAVIDGASRFQTLKFITLPLLKPIIFLILIIRMMDSFRVFDQVFVLTRGGPGRSTQILSYVVYLTGISYRYLGYASAMSYFMLIILVVLTLVLLRLLRRS